MASGQSHVYELHIAGLRLRCRSRLLQAKQSKSYPSHNLIVIPSEYLFYQITSHKIYFRRIEIKLILELLRLIFSNMGNKQNIIFSIILNMSYLFYFFLNILIH